MHANICHFQNTVIFISPALYENARREEAQMFQMQQWLQYGVGPEETHGGLWENIQVHMRMPVCKSGCVVVSYLQNRT